MQNINNKILYFIFFSTLLFFLKPSILFKNEYSFREFGVGLDSEGYQKTLFNIFTIILIGLVILNYII